MTVSMLLICGLAASQSSSTQTPESSFATHREELNLHILKTHSDHTDFNHLVEHVYEVTAGKPSDEEDFLAPGITGVFFDKVRLLAGLKSFKLSFSLGNLPNEELFSLPQQLPRFGSFFVAHHTGGPTELVDLGFVLSTFFGLANGRITHFERLQNTDLGVSWYSYAPEYFCVEHLYKMLKFYPHQGGLHKLLTEGDTIMLQYSYSSVEVEYKAQGPAKRPVLRIVLRAAVPDSQIKKVLAVKFTTLAALDPRASVKYEQLVPKIRRYDHYQEKVLDLDMSQLTVSADTEGQVVKDSYSIQELLTLAKHKKTPKTNLSLAPRSYQIDRFIRGRISSFNNTLVHIVRGKNFDLQGATQSDGGSRNIMKIMAVSDSHQHFFLSDIQVVRLLPPSQDSRSVSAHETGDVVRHTARYISRNVKPNSNLPITIVEVAFEVGLGEAVEVRMPYLINLRKVNEYEQEYERGTYLLGSVATLSALSSPSKVTDTHILPPLLTNEKMIDSTFAFTTLTINNVIFFILPITVMFLGISVR